MLWCRGRTPFRISSSAVTPACPICKPIDSSFRDDCAYLEGSCAGVEGQMGRISYCVAYDLIGSWISAIRGYGAVGPFLPTDSAE
jgi:hypothetical protein